MQTQSELSSLSEVHWMGQSTSKHNIIQGGNIFQSKVSRLQPTLE